MAGFEDDSEAYDFRDDEREADDSEVADVVERLRETLTYDMVLKAYRGRFGCDPDENELEDFMEDLINEHYNAGLDEWNEDYLYYD